MPEAGNEGGTGVMGIKASDINEQSPWQEMTVGGEVYEGGTARATITGEWRSNRPVWIAVCPLLPGLFHSGNRRKTV